MGFPFLIDLNPHAFITFNGTGTCGASPSSSMTLSIPDRSLMRFEYSQNFYNSSIDTVNDPVVRLDQLAQFTTGNLGHQPSGEWLIHEKIRATKQPVDEHHRRRGIIFSNIRLDLA